MAQSEGYRNTEKARRDGDIYKYYLKLKKKKVGNVQLMKEEAIREEIRLKFYVSNDHAGRIIAQQYEIVKSNGNQLEIGI